MTAADAPLQALQRWMLGALMTPGEVDRSAVIEALLPGAQLDAAGCLAIYQRSYVLRLRLCLGEQFPATRHALGPRLFDDFADDYLHACPSDSYTLYELGRRFPYWLEETRPDRDQPHHAREPWIDFMVDLAHYEHALFRLFDAPGDEGRPWPDAGTDDRALVLQPCLALAQYRYPVARYYHEVCAGRSPELPERAPSQLVILRRDHQTATYPVSPLHHRFLHSLQQQRSVAQALADVAAWTRRPLDDVVLSWRTDVRSAWIDAGFFALAD